MEQSKHAGAWAVCPRPQQLDSDKEPMVFETLEKANEFLNSQIPQAPPEEVCLASGISIEEVIENRKQFNEAQMDYERRCELGEISFLDIPLRFHRRLRRDQGWLNPIPVMEVSGSQRSREQSFREFLPLTELGLVSRKTFDEAIDEVFISATPEFSCYLGESWRFEDIVADLRWRSGHKPNGLKHASVVEIIVKAIYDVDDSMRELHPGISPVDCAEFFASWQVWRYAAEISTRTGKSAVAESVAGDRYRAMDQAGAVPEFLYERFAVFSETLKRTAKKHPADSSTRENVPIKALTEIPTTPTPDPVNERSIGQQIDDLRLKCEWSAEQLAEAIKIAPRSVYRHLSDTDTPSKLNLAKYSKIFSQALHIEVVITKTSAKVSKRHNKS
jgi:hypothetical protein